jgi:hypothetical protein
MKENNKSDSHSSYSNAMKKIKTGELGEAAKLGTIDCQCFG